MSERHYISARADRVYKRLQEWYGAKLTEKDPPPDLCKLIDASSADALKRVMAVIPRQHPTWPPTYGEFAALFASQTPTDERTSQSIDWNDRLAQFTARVVNRYWHDWSEAQRRGWEYLGSGDARTGVGFRFTGMRIPADPANNKPARTYLLDEVGA